MNRRHFLRRLLVGLAIAGAFALGVYRLLRGSRADGRAAAGPAFSERVRSALAPFAPDDALLLRFERDHARHAAPSGRAERDVQLAARFLMSTDFFQHDGDESRALTYVAYYDPYVSPCYNPLARLD